MVALDYIPATGLLEGLAPNILLMDRSAPSQSPSWAQKPHVRPLGAAAQTNADRALALHRRTAKAATRGRTTIRIRTCQCPLPHPCKGDRKMASRPEIKVKKSEPDDTVQELPNQKAKKEAGNYRLQVDRQTKAFYMTEEAAEAAGLVIKKGHPVVQVSIYNSAEGVNKIIELPK
jgi:hypothetical protein